MRKKFKLLSALLLSAQIFSISPLSVLADELEAKEPSTEVREKEDEEESSQKKDKEKEKENGNNEGKQESEEEETDNSEEKEENPEKPVDPENPEKPNNPEKPKTNPSQPDKPKPAPNPEKKPAPEENTTPESKPEDPQPEEITSETVTSEQNHQDLVESVDTIQQPTPTNPIQNNQGSQIIEVGPSHKTNGSTIHFEKNETTETFVRKIGNSARKIGQKTDLYASVMIAQAMLESGNGSSQLSQAPYYNLFGIKGSHNGKSVSFATQEDLGDGEMITIQSGFRVYDSYEESLEDYAELLKEGITGNPDFYSGTWKQNAESYTDATEFLTGKYATDSQYNDKLNGLIETYGLTEYDKEFSSLEINADGFAVPLNNYSISSTFGPRGSEFHRGLDLAAGQGEPIYSSKDGVVLKAEYHDSWGNYVVLEHNDGMTTLYAHQAEYVVAEGESVLQGDLIGFVGSTGNSTGPHLHLEICKDSSLTVDKLLNPSEILFNR